ncbi:prepilin-type N-terminal cleavage/methylation domain-containing protein [uncultured Anaerococcus sp.]|uniref:pilin n=1 Tax=uncultured Anaerococcus sp. TaxID=293428 RepID=UPI00288BF9BD|nr:prepilin-type N-terminal cleavage/methylation domain-containing protein [uncultured Anaerococcus sp.]
MKKKRRAFTLIELIIVIAILGILVAIAIPKYNKSRIQAAVTAHKANVEMLKSAARMKILDEDKDFTWKKKEKVSGTDVKDVNDYDKYVEKWPEVPNGLKTDTIKEYIVTYVHSKNELTVTPAEDAFDDKLKK